MAPRRWIHRDLGQVTHLEEADYARRFLATKMGDALCFGTNGRKLHRQFAPSSGPSVNESVSSRLAAYVTNGPALVWIVKMKTLPIIRASSLDS